MASGSRLAATRAMMCPASRRPARRHGRRRAGNDLAISGERYCSFRRRFSCFSSGSTTISRRWLTMRKPWARAISLKPFDLIGADLHHFDAESPGAVEFGDQPRAVAAQRAFTIHENHRPAIREGWDGIVGAIGISLTRSVS
jgi:hypothetical protein